MTATPKGEKKPRQKAPALHLVSIEMADGSDINGPEAQLRIARALVGLAGIRLQGTANAAD